MIREEIISSIDEITTARNNAEMSVLESLICCYEKQNTLIEEASIDDISMFPIFDDISTEIIQEANEIKKRKSGFNAVLSNIWNAIKSFLNMIVNGFKKFIDKFKKQVGSPVKAGESVSSIAERVIRNNKSHNKPDDIDSWPVPKINPKYVVQAGGEIKQESFIEESFIQESAKNESDKSEKIIIPSDPKSEIKGETVELKRNGVVISPSEDKNKMKITYYGFGKFSGTKIKDPTNSEDLDIPGQEKEWYSSPKLALHLITHDDARKQITELVESALKVMKHRKAEDVKAFKKKEKIGKMVKIFMTPESHTYEVTIDQIKAVQSWASSLLIDMEAYTSTDVDIREFDKDIIKELNMVVRLLMRIQISLNYISSALNNSYIIDGEFYKAIRNLDVLDQFVGECIKAGIPPKYVAFNAWLISDECIRGDGKYKPLFGHARATIFPPNKKIVIKIALSGLGVVSNETEVRFTELFKDMDRIDLIAPVLKEFKTNSIVAMERVDGNFNLSSSTCKKFAKKADEALTEYQKKTGKKLNIQMGSQHVGNVAYDYKYKVYRSIDYGVHYRNP